MDYESGVGSDVVLQRAFALTGGVPDQVPLRLIGAAPEPQLDAFLRAHSGRILAVEPSA